jgi:hypothetical protein
VKIYSSIHPYITERTVRAALDAEQSAGRIAPHVRFKLLHGLNPRTAAAAVEVQLEATERDRGRRFGNSGSYGATNEYSVTPDQRIFAATYDEWGWLLQRLYADNDELMVGAPTADRAIYSGRDDFEHKTALTYRADLAELLESDGDVYPYISGRSTIGARGRGRRFIDEVGVHNWCKLDERTPEWARSFYAGEVF